MPFRPMLCSTAIAGLILVAACAPPEVAVRPGCAAPTVSMSGWVERRGSAFTIQLPADLQPRRTEGIDSEIGVWASRTREISYDYGSYSPRLLDYPQRDRWVCMVEIGGRPARVVTGRGLKGGYVAAAHWANLGPGVSQIDTTSLTIIGTAPDSIGRRELLASIWTVRFRK